MQNVPEQQQQQQQHQLKQPNNNQQTSGQIVTSKSGNATSTNNVAGSHVDLPLRILVPNELVGAIIGKCGQTIRQLTQQSRAKVDVYRGDRMAPSSSTLSEKIITIRGQPENCINACKEIFKVMIADTERQGKPSDLPLKVLVHDDFIGRIIGKQGNIINSIKKETDTTVAVSNSNDMSLNAERVVTITGQLDNMIQALESIYNRVRSAYENDTKLFQQQQHQHHQSAHHHQASHMNLMNNVMFSLSNGPGMQHQQPPYASAPYGYSTTYPVLGPHQYPATLAPPPPPPPAHHQQHHGSTKVSGRHSSSTTTQGYANSVTTAGYGVPHVPPQSYATAQSSGSFVPSNTYYPPVSSQPPPNAPAGAGTGANLHHHYGGPSSSASNQVAPVASQPITNGVASLPSQKPPNYKTLNGLGVYHAPGMPENLSEPEQVFLYIPNNSVGAIIGARGSFIKNIIKSSGASIKITQSTAPSHQQQQQQDQQQKEQQEQQKENENETNKESAASSQPAQQQQQQDRQVVIIGVPDSQCKAQYYIYEKIRQERYTTDDNVKLTAELQVPAYLVGKIIGKGGKNIKDLQRITGASIKLIGTSLNQKPETENKSTTEASTAPAEESKSATENAETKEEASKSSEANVKKTTTEQADETEKTQATASDEKSPNEASGNDQSATVPQETDASNENELIIVRINGTFYESQLAQRRIQSLIQKNHPMQSTKMTTSTDQGAVSGESNSNSNSGANSTNQSKSAKTTKPSQRVKKEASIKQQQTSNKNGSESNENASNNADAAVNKTETNETPNSAKPATEETQAVA